MKIMLLKKNYTILNSANCFDCFANAADECKIRTTAGSQLAAAEIDATAINGVSSSWLLLQYVKHRLAAESGVITVLL